MALPMNDELKAIIAANKAKALSNDELVKAVSNKNGRKDGTGMLSILPAGEYRLINIEQADDDAYEYEICTFIDVNNKRYRISLGTMIKPIFNEAGEDINACCPLTLDLIGECFDVKVDNNVFGSRPLYGPDGQRVLADEKSKFKFYSETMGETYKGKKTVVMTVTKL